MKLIREPVGKHPFRLHRWRDVDGMVGLFGIIEQCVRCHRVRVYNPISNLTWTGSHEMLTDERIDRA